MANKPKTIIKRKAGSVSISKKRRGIRKFQVVALVSALALIGVVAVALTRASGTPNYQYSWNKYCIAAYGSSSASEVQSCKDTSAEAITYRLYAGMLKRVPTASEYSYWTQKFAGDRVKVSESSLLTSQTAKMGSNSSFVTSLYTNMLKRTPNSKEVSQWTAKLTASGSKKWSRERIVAQFAISAEAIRKNQSGFNSFAKTHTVTVTQTAANDQRKRFEDLRTVYLDPAKKSLGEINALKSQSQTLASQSKTLADKKLPSSGDLASIAVKSRAVRDKLDTAKRLNSTIAAKADTASRVYLKAKTLADFATDIRDNTVYGIKAIKSRSDYVRRYANDSKAASAALTNEFNKIALYYANAENKYEADQKVAVAKTPIANQPCPEWACGKPAVAGKPTTAQLDLIWANHCNGAPDHTQQYFNADAAKIIKNSVGVAVVYDVYYINDGQHRRSCNERFKKFDTARMTCSTPGFHAEGDSCLANPKQLPISKGKQCPAGFFPAQGYCWNGAAAQTRTINIDEKCRSGLEMYKAKSVDGVVLIECRQRKPQYAGY